MKGLVETRIFFGLIMSTLLSTKCTSK